MYVGDNYYADIVGAQKAGLKPVPLDIGSIFENPGCHIIKSLPELKEIL
jgi:hypothetical protein